MPRRAAKPIAPVEFLFTAYICFRFPQATHSQLSKLIQGLMQRARGEHSDLMLNSRVEKTLRTYIQEMEMQYPQWMAGGNSSSSTTTTTTTTSTTENGRKRVRDDEEEDENRGPTTDEIAAVRSRADYLPV